MPITEDWFARRTWQTPDWVVEDLIAAKRGRKVSVVLPALNEEATIGAIVAGIRPFTEGDRPLVDDLLVMDSGSTDDTIPIARENGAPPATAWSGMV